MPALKRYRSYDSSDEEHHARSTDKGNELHLDDAPFGLEKMYDYRSGGHYVIHLGHLVGENGRYKVIHKLGSGGFANVWLCRDLESQDFKYVGLKILMAEETNNDCRELVVNEFKTMGLDADKGGKFICQPLDHFQIGGSNGSHYCFVYPVLGPQVSCILQEFKDPDGTLRKVSLQAVQGLATLHKHGLCHGDFTPSNILLAIRGLDGLSEAEVLHEVGEPQLAVVTTKSGGIPTDPGAPKYLVRPINFYKLDTRFVSDQASIIDFGESYKIASPPENLGIPQPYRSPELVLDNSIGISCDIWALGCTLFEIRTGRRLFDMFGDEVDDFIYHVVLILGKLPDHWWNSWEGRKDIFEDEVDAHGRAVRVPEEGEAGETAAEGYGHSVVSVMSGPRSLHEALARGLNYVDASSRLGKNFRRTISQKEINLFADLLCKILKYEPEERISAKDVLGHEWFMM